MGGEAMYHALLDGTDIEPITTCRQFVEEVAVENGRLWRLAGPAIFTAVAQYSLGAVTQVFAGHLTTLELDAVSTENMVIAGLAYGIMVCTSVTNTEENIICTFKIYFQSTPYNSVSIRRETTVLNIIRKIS